MIKVEDYYRANVCNFIYRNTGNTCEVATRLGS